MNIYLSLRKLIILLNQVKYLLHSILFLVYEPIARKGWQGLQSQMEPDGTVHNICVGTMSSEDPSYYKNRPAVDDDSHGLLGLFICGLEMETLLKGK